LRSYAAGLDFVYLTPSLCVCRTPKTKAEAEHLSAHFNSKHPRNHKVFNCSAYSSTKAVAQASAAAPIPGAESSKHRSAALQSISTGVEGEEISIAPSELTSARYFDSSEDYRGPISLKQLMHCAHRADSYLAGSPHGVLIFMCETGAGKSCVYAASFLLYIGAVLSSEEACVMVAKERCQTSPSAADAQPSRASSTAAALLQHTSALRIPSHRRYVSYFESLLRSDNERWRCNTYQLSRLRVLGGIPNLQPSLLSRGCRLHVVVKVAKFLPREEDGYARPPSSKAAQEQLAEATGAEVVVLFPLFNQVSGVRHPSHLCSAGLRGAVAHRCACIRAVRLMSPCVGSLRIFRVLVLPAVLT